MSDIDDVLQRRLAPKEWERLQTWLEDKTFVQKGEALGYALGYTEDQHAKTATLPEDLDSMLFFTRLVH